MEYGASRPSRGFVTTSRRPSTRDSSSGLLEIELPEAIGAPEGPSDGPYRLAALDRDGMPLDVQALRFPDRVEFEGPEGSSEMALATAEGSAMGYLTLTEEVASVVVADPEGAILASRVEGLEDPRRARTGHSEQALLNPVPEGPCGHVAFLEATDTIWFPVRLREDYDLVDIPARALAALISGLGRLSPMACAGLGRIAFASFPAEEGRTGAFVDLRYGDLVVINATFDADGRTFTNAGLRDPATFAFLEGTIIHEAGHAVTYLLEQAAPFDARTDGAWAPTRRRLGDATIRNARLRGGFLAEWIRLHRSFEDAEWAGAYASYPLALLDGFLGSSGHRFRVRFEDAPAGDFSVEDGWVLLTEATNRRIVGSVFFREVYRSGLVLPDYETFEPPVLFRFLLER